MENPIVERLRELLDTSPENDMSLTEMARQMGISVYYMSHLFKKHTGLSVMEYRTRRRIAMATELLENTSDSITRIAYLCGFSCQGYFTERFSRLMGICPTEYREKMQSCKDNRKKD